MFSVLPASRWQGHGREADRRVIAAFSCDRPPFRRQDAGGTLNTHLESERLNSVPEIDRSHVCKTYITEKVISVFHNPRLSQRFYFYYQRSGTGSLHIPGFPL